MAVVDEYKKGTKIAVVVSAMGKTTDVLMSTARSTSNGKLEKKDLDDILSMGERTSVRIFSAALKNNGVSSCYFDPLDCNWPIITDDSFQNANPLVEDCEKNIKEYILPLVDKGTVPVIAGFVGKTKDRKITTLGRGGSDTTAFLIAQALNASQVVLVTDAEEFCQVTLKSLIRQFVTRVNVNTLVGLADSGAKLYTVKLSNINPKILILKQELLCDLKMVQ